MALLIATLAALIFLLILIVRWRVHAFLALVIAALGLALIAGMRPEAIVASLQKGIGDLLGSIALIIGAGAILGRLLDVSAGATVLADGLTKVLGSRRMPLTMLATGYIVGIPVFFDAAFFTLIPLAWGLSESSRRSLLFYALPILASLTITHGLIPTHPGTAAAAQLLMADLGKTTLLGTLLAIPSALAGLVYGVWIARRTPFVSPPSRHKEIVRAPKEVMGRRPSFVTVLLLLLLPIALITAGVFGERLFPADSMIAGWLKFWGNPGVALLLAVLTALVVLARRRGLRLEGLRGEVSHALNDVGSLILIIGASGAFKQVIVDSGAGAEFAGLLLRWHIPPLGSAFLVGAALRIALGSATASMITAAGLVAPVAASSAASHVLIALALTAGASVFANVNDAGFWMVQEYCGMSVSQTLKTYSMVKAVTATTAFAIICIIACFT